MDRQWCPSPGPRPIQGNVCPSCFVVHFPFCPPPPRLPFQGDHSFQPPPFSPYPGPFPPTNPNWDRQSFRPPYDHGNRIGFIDEGENRNFKRPRIDYSGGPYKNDYDTNSLNNSSEDERRLKLIRDHGVALSNTHDDMHTLQNGGGYKQHNQNGFPSDFVHGEVPPPHSGQFKTTPYRFRSYGTGNLDQWQRVPHAVPEVSGGSYHTQNPQQHQNGPSYFHIDSDLHRMKSPYPEQIGNGDPNKLLPQPYGTQHPVHTGHDFHPSAQTAQSSNVTMLGHEVTLPSHKGNQSQVGQQDTSRFLRGQPSLPASPPPPLPLGSPINHSSHLKTYLSPSKKPASFFPISASSSAMAPSSSLPHPFFHSKPLQQFSTGFPPEEPSKQYLGDAQPFSLKQLSAEKPKFIDASHLFQHPHRTSRPDHFVIIFRGLTGSGKSYLAKMLRDLEVENGGDAPRIHSMDDYFMTEVEKVEDNDGSKSSSSGKKKPVIKVMEYCYEPEMEEAYRSSMLKAFKKTVEEGSFTLVMVDDRNLRVADFAQFWATAKRSGYEVYILEATYKDPAGCAARNVHGFTQEDIEKMAGQWEEAPSLYLQLDVKSLFHGDDLKQSRIQEVDMDMEDDHGDALPAVQGRDAEKVVDPPDDDATSSLKDGKRWDVEVEHSTEVRELGKSKWSEDFGEDDIDKTEGMKGKINTLSGLVHPHGKEQKSVHWGDQVGHTGFSIGAARKVNAWSLVIGPGAGYNLKSNPLPEEESQTTRGSVEPKKHSTFQERIRAERESFKAVFDRRRQRIGGLDVDED